MKLAYKAFYATLLLLTLVFTATAQLSNKDPRNTAPTVGTGGPQGGPTGLFTVYDGRTLRKGEYTVSAALSNFDRDPGNVDITTVPLSFQIGLTNRLELFFNTEGWRGIKTNSPRNLSSFYLPDAQFFFAPAIVLAPRGPGNPTVQGAIFRPAGNQVFVAFPYSGGNAGTYGLTNPFFSGNIFGFTPGTNALLGPPRPGGGGGMTADLFPGVGSVFGSILPGIVLQTVPLLNNAGAPVGTAPAVFTTAPSYLPDAPFVGTTYGKNYWNSFSGGVKWRFNNPNNAVGYGLIASYRWNMDRATSTNGFAQLQTGSGAGGNWGDVGLTLFADARLAKWVNVSGNVGFVYNSSVKGNFPNGKFTLLDRPNELQSAVGVDFPVSKYLQYIFEFRSLQYVGGRTPNAFENDPIEALAGLRVFPARWFGFGVAYRYHVNQQDRKSFGNQTSSATFINPCSPIVGGPPCTPVPVTTTWSGTPPGFDASTDGNGYILQGWIGRRQKRLVDVVNQHANVDAVDLTGSTITLPCKPGFKSRSGACNDTGKTIGVTTHASDPDNDVLTYNYTVSGGHVAGSTANVQWDLSGAQAGTYTITVGVDDGCGVCGKTETKTVTVQECPDCIQICTCPELSLSGPSGVTSPGDTMTFTANVSGGDVTYNWSVSAGTIASGQGTPSITVGTTKEMAGSNVTATVDIGGVDTACNCVTTRSETAPVATAPIATTVDEFGAQKDDEVKARVDNFYIQLNNNPNAQGYIINYGNAAQIKKRRAQIMKAITFRKYDVSRVTFVDGPDNGNGESTKFWLVPPGATPPTP